jgi:hypothetical protein
MGRDFLWRVHLRAGETVSASAVNFASMGFDPMFFYVVRDCRDPSSCLSLFGSYTATTDETVYLVLDHFESADYPPTYVSVEVR